MFGFITLKYIFGYLWFLLNMIANRTVSFPTMVMIAALLAAGLTMVVNPLREADKVPELKLRTRMQSPRV